MIFPIPPTWFLLTCGLAIGLCLGSFITMLSYRLPRRLSIIRPGSHCPACKTPLTPRELIPLLSWLLQKGRCRTCQTFTGWRYPAIELATAIATTVSFLLIGLSFLLLLPIALIIAAMTLLTIHLEHHSTN